MDQWSMPSFAKINIGLKILGKRKDGFHEIRTVFQTINLSDQIEIRYPSDQLNIICQQMLLPKSEDNLIAKVILLLRKKGFSIPPLEIFLDKKIPLGSGLGGGSSNAATTLMALNELFHLNLSCQEMMSLGAQIGSDVPFFLWGGTALGTGRGEEIRPLRGIGDYWICLAIPKRKSLTKDAYAKASVILTEKKKDINITNFIYSISKGEPDFSLAKNDFERLLFKKDRVVTATKELFKKYHSPCVMLSGSGSAMYALFQDRESAEKAVKAVKASELKDKVILLFGKTIDAGAYQKRIFHDIRK